MLSNRRCGALDVLTSSTDFTITPVEMQIKESTVIGKKSQATCEDGIVTTDDFIAVIDGSTSKTSHRQRPGLSNGRLAMQRICEYISNMPADICLRNCCKGLTHCLSSPTVSSTAVRQYMLLPPIQRPTASLGIYNRYRKEVWLIGDCQCLIDGQHHQNPKPHEAELAEARSIYIKQQLGAGHTIEEFQKKDTGRAHIMPLLIRACDSQNIDYAVVDGTPIPIRHIKVIPCRKAREIVLASDGYPLLLPTLEASEQFLAQVLQDDPLMTGAFKATKGLMQGNKSFDDRCYIRFTP